MAGPRSEPPMPMFTTSVTRPPAPSKPPPRTASAKRSIRSSVSRTSGITSRPSTITEPSSERSAVWSTARPSVSLIRSPANMASRRASTPAASASARSRSRARASMWVLE